MKKVKPVPPNPEDFKNFVDLVAVYAESHHRLASMELSLEEVLRENFDPTRREFARAQRSLAEAESAIELMARQNPTWFEGKKSIVTPYGKVAFRKSTKLQVADELTSLNLLKISLGKDSEMYIRTTESLDLEALEKEPDDFLAKHRIKRVEEEAFSVKPSKIDLGKAFAPKKEVAK